MRFRNRSGVRARLMLAAALFMATFLWGCGDDTPTSPEDSGDLPASPGTGSLTLKVVAQALVRDTGPGAWETDFHATVDDALGTPVPGATVTIAGAFGTVTLSPDTAAGSYSATRDGFYTGSYTLDVHSGADSLTGVTALAPTVHTMLTPEADDTVEANTALLVRWTSNGVSNQCRLETRDYDSDWISGDPGTLWTPSIGNPPRTDQRVRLERRNVQIAARGLPGSQMAVCIRKVIEPIVAE
jgi:hypothetical protein